MAIEAGTTDTETENIIEFTANTEINTTTARNGTNIMVGVSKNRILK